MDAELDLMRSMASAFEQLDRDARQRVLNWIAARFDLSVGTPRQQGAAAEGNASNSTSPEFGDFADLFYAAQPKSQAERSLVAAYWLAAAGESFPSQAINGLLKDLGFQVPNITDALSQNMREKPALVVQIKKSGNTRQARKLYKITDAGVRRVKAMFRSATSQGEFNG